MCGIAGYNASDKIAERYLKDKPELAKDLLRKAWLHNLHRGFDACGYMGQTLDHFTDTYRAVGTAVDSLIEEVDQDEFVMEPMAVFAAHTRAATDGDPKDNKNNHPVSYGKWHVTHNGQINNFNLLKNRFVPAKEKDKWPGVDSSIIPLVLEQNMESAYDTQGLYDACRLLQGAFAFHAINENYPGVSIFVRGTGRPFTIANLHKKLFVYGSEPESVWSLIDTMGINPNKGFDWISLDTEHFLIVERGEIIEWGSFRSNYSNNTRSQITKRWLPREDERPRTLVYSEDSDNSYANKSPSKSVRERVDDAKLIYSRTSGFTDSKRDFPFDNDMNTECVMSEADFIYELDGYWHCLFGTVELVVHDSGRTVKDVFNHALPFTMGQRFETHKKKNIFKNGIPGAGMKLSDFMHLRTSDLKEADIPQGESEYQYVADMREAKKRQEEKEAREAQKEKEKTNVVPFTGKLPSPAKTNGDLATTSNENMDEIDDETWIPEIISPEDRLSWNTFFQATVTHSWEPLFFLQDRICPNHKQVFSQHTHPETCQVVLYAASYAMAACEVMDLYNAYEHAYAMDYATDDKYCPDNDKRCNFLPAELVKVTNTYTSWYVRVSEHCNNCGAYRTLAEDPAWWSLINVGDRMSILTTGVK